MEISPLLLGLAFSWGLLLGFFYFGGLWVTVRRLPGSVRPRTTWFLSFLFRLSLAVAGLLAAMKVNTVAFFVTLVAFFVVRMIMSRKIGQT
jgi:F1F0 ATPase subunit 2